MGDNGPRAHLRALATAEPAPFWIDESDEPESEDTLVDHETADLCVIGGGYTGLWTALLAKERDPTRDVVVLEAGRCGSAASGRNGGFFESSLTHGVANGLRRFPEEMALLEKLGLENLDAIERFVEEADIDCDWERNGVVEIATTPPLADKLAIEAAKLESLGQHIELWDRDRVRSEIRSPTYEAGLYRIRRAAVCDPARLAFGLKRVAIERGVRIFEDTSATEVADAGSAVTVTTGYGSVRAARVAMATNAFPPLVRQIKRYIAPVYDYVLATEPLSPQQLSDIGWEGRQGVSDTANQFHYYRLTADNRIVWGGYDAVYYFGGRVGASFEQRPETFAVLADHFFETFPQLEGLNFSHAWGGAIDTCSRFTVFWGTTMGGKAGYALGYTGLGAAASRFGARVMLDLLDDRQSPVAGLDFVRNKPIPFPPEPLRWAGIQMTRWSLDRADQHDGQRNLWLRTLDRLGLGFDS